jgi:hypothetical protein
MMDSFFESASTFWLLASSLVPFVDFRALGAVRSMKVASDYDSDGDTDGQPDGDVAGGDAHRGADAGAESNTQDGLHRTSFHVSFLKIMTTTAGRAGTPVLHRLVLLSLAIRLLRLVADLTDLAQ